MARGRRGERRAAGSGSGCHRCTVSTTGVAARRCHVRTALDRALAAVSANAGVAANIARHDLVGDDRHVESRASRKRSTDVHPKGVGTGRQRDRIAARLGRGRSTRKVPGRVERVDSLMDRSGRARMIGSFHRARRPRGDAAVDTGARVARRASGGGLVGLAGTGRRQRSARSERGRRDDEKQPKYARYVHASETVRDQIWFRCG